MQGREGLFFGQSEVNLFFDDLSSIWFDPMVVRLCLLLRRDVVLLLYDDRREDGIRWGHVLFTKLKTITMKGHFSLT